MNSGRGATDKRARLLNAVAATPCVCVHGRAAARVGRPGWRGHWATGWVRLARSRWAAGGGAAGEAGPRAVGVGWGSQGARERGGSRSATARPRALRWARARIV
jgi:hypothetical protein